MLWGRGRASRETSGRPTRARYEGTLVRPAVAVSTRRETSADAWSERSKSTAIAPFVFFKYFINSLHNLE